jgi:hypothetical protein
MLKQEKERYVYALELNLDLYKKYNNKEFNFYKIVFTNRMLAYISKERGMQRT